MKHTKEEIIHAIKIILYICIIGLQVAAIYVGKREE